MHVYRLLDIIPYDCIPKAQNLWLVDSKVANDISRLHDKSLPAERIIICLSEDGMDVPDAPCIIIDEESWLVYMPDGDFWHIGGRTFAKSDIAGEFHTWMGPAERCAYMIWRWS